MELIFDKDGKGLEEMQEYFSHIPGTLDFDDLKTDVLMAQEELYRYVGEEIIGRAVTHYQSDNYNIETDELEAEEKELYELNDDLVEHIQLPVCLMAYREFALNNDATHSKTGRIVRMDKDTDTVDSSVIDRDDRALLRKIQKALDRLIRFVNENEFKEWVNSDVYKETRDLILWNADLFQRFHPIEYSHRLFMLLVPMIRRIQTNRIANVLGSERMAALMAKVKAGTVTSGDASGSGSSTVDYMKLRDMAAYPLAYLALAAGYRELPVQLFPENMSRQFWNAGNGIAFVTLRDNVISALEKEGNQQYQNLLYYIEQLDAEDEGTTIDDDSITDISERMDEGNLFARV